jgi:RimJ/RimL family protein N-acetyltransferase
VDAILEGRAEGQVYVDDRARPRAALARRKQRCYLAVEEAEAGAALLRDWSQVLYPRLQAEGHQIYVLYVASDEWAALVEETLVARAPIPAPRQYWAIATADAATAPALPPGYQVLGVDRALLELSGLMHLDGLREEVDSEHASAEAFQRESFGVCAVHAEREIAGWCLAEYASAERCEAGIETVFRHRRRGLGAAMTAALVEQARARGLTQVGWHSYTRNVPSIATARKAGLHKVCDYPAYIGHFDPVYHLSERGYTALGEGRAAEGLAWLEKAFAQGEAPGWAYYSAGAACALLGQQSRALGYLERAVERGFDERTIYESDGRLGALHDRAEWAALLDRMGAPDPSG